MPVVYRKKDGDPRRRFHRVRDCELLAKAPPKGVFHEIEEVDLSDLPRAVPCKRCYPDAPRAVSVHLLCRVCNTGSAPRPCAHNGGIGVWMVRTRRQETLLHSAGETYMRRDYVWPEQVRHYTI